MKGNKSRTRTTRQSQNFSILKSALEQSHLVKIQRMFLKHSSTPNEMYRDSLLLDYPNPALDEKRRQKFDSTFEVDYLLHNLYRKLLIPGITPKEKLDEAAYRSFFRGERNNVRTNNRLKRIAFGDVEVNTFVFRCQKLIYQILGELDLDRIAELSHFSSGATATLNRSESSPQGKYAFRNPSCTRSVSPFLHYLRKEHDEATGFGRRVTVVNYNRVLTVPKSNSTNRTIAAEPTLNMYFQLGVGSYIRSRLRRFGIDLNDQTVNQELARQGSITGALSTLDLENASNSVSYELVKLLLPSDWFEVLDALRSPYGLVKGRLHRYRMFSSMGNGYTFELESMLFFVIAKVASSKKATVSVYGDDLIVETADAPNVIHWLNYFGFGTNAQKSFSDGFFRESCGKHYHSGVDVTPFFVRRIPRKTDIYLLFNNIVRWSSKNLGFDPRFAEIAEYVLNLIPSDSRIFGPDGYGDGHLLEVEGIGSSSFKYDRRLCALTFKSLVLVFSKRRANQKGALCASLLGLTKNEILSYITDDLKKSYRQCKIQVQS